MKIYNLRNNDFIFANWYFLKYRLYQAVVNAKTKNQIEKDRLTANYNQRILELKNTHEGETCFIIGNGPSSLSEDFRRIQESGIDSFGANRILDSVPGLQWRPTYLSVMDPGFLISKGGTTTPKQYCEQIKRCGISRVFFTDELRPYASDFSINPEPLYFRVLHSFNYSDKLPDFSDNPALYVADLGNVTHFNIQLACYMGYKTIILYGVDNTYTKYLGHDGKFHREPAGKDNYLPGVTLMESEKAQASEIPKFHFQAVREMYADLRKADYGFALCKRYADDHGIAIVNATRGGKLDIFKRVEIEEMIPY